MSFAAATAPPRELRRILVLGGCGSGKSTFARRLGDLTGLPVVHLDREYFSPGWVEPERESWVRRLSEIAARERWIIDGNHVRKAFAERAGARTSRSSSTCRRGVAYGVCCGAS